MQVVKLHLVEIGDAYVPDSGCCQVHRCWASQASSPNDKRLRSLQSFLSRYTNFIEKDMPTVASELFRIEDLRTLFHRLNRSKDDELWGNRFILGQLGVKIKR